MESNAVSASVGWIQGALMGSAAVAISVLAVASVGLMMMTGRVDTRRGLRVVIGCFIIFGAPAIAAGILKAVSQMSAMDSRPAVTASTLPPPPPPAVTVQAAPYDPYAGAALPPPR